MYEFLQETVEGNAPETTVGDLYRLFAMDDYDAYPVVRDDIVVGFVIKLDALKVFAFTPGQILPHYDDHKGTIVDEIMSCNVAAAEPETRLQRVLQLMIRHRLKSLPVIDKFHHLVGIIARDDIMRALGRCTQRQAAPLLPCETARCLPLG